MTREEALKVLDTIPTIGEQVDALEMAIEALEQEPCKDCISREDAMSMILCYGNEIKTEVMNDIKASMIKLPSVTPQPKIGQWLEKEVISDKVIEEWQSARCSVCDKYHTTPYMYYFSNYKFCPNCGARLEDEET